MEIDEEIHRQILGSTQKILWKRERRNYSERQQRQVHHIHTQNKQTNKTIESSNLGFGGLIEIEPLTREHTWESCPFMKRKDEWMVSGRGKIWRRVWEERRNGNSYRVDNFINL